MQRGCRRALLALLTSVLALVLTTGVADAVWSPGGAGSGSATAKSVGLPTSTAATATSWSTVSVGWAAPSGAGAPPTQYFVRRTAPTAAAICTVAATTFSCTDTGLSASTTYTYSVEAVAASWSSGTTSGFSATTPAAPTFKVAPAAGNRTAGTAFNVTLIATTDGVATDTTYTGVHAITFSGPSTSPSGASPTYPATVTFSAGVGTASITLVAAQSTSLAATDGTWTGSASVTVVAGASSGLTYTSSTPSCASGSVTVGPGGTFVSKVTVLDLYANPVSQSAATTVSLTRSPTSGSLSPTSLSIPLGASETTSSFTYTRPASGATAVIVTASRSGLTSATCSVRR